LFSSVSTVIAASAIVAACSDQSDPAPDGSPGFDGTGGTGAPTGGFAGTGGVIAGTGGAGGVRTGVTGGVPSSGSGGVVGGAASTGGASTGGSSGGASGRGSGGASDADGAAGTGGGAGGATGNDGGDGGATCPFTGHVTYTLAKSANPTPAEQNAYALITAAMDTALAYYNCYTDITKQVNVSYVPSVATADGNINGSMRFGSNTFYMDYRTAMHELSHTVGVGQASNWRSFVVGGLFTGTNANAELAAINQTLQTPVDTELHADNNHFWPYGINQQNEVKSEADLIAHCRIVRAMRRDLGLQ
jgi:hypothetical protein